MARALCDHACIGEQVDERVVEAPAGDRAVVVENVDGEQNKSRSCGTVMLGSSYLQTLCRCYGRFKYVLILADC